MLVKATATFPYAHDGLNVRFVHEDEEFECRDDLAPGLSGAGKIDGAPHGLPLLDEHRRASIIEKLVAAVRAEFAELDDERLMDMSYSLDREMAQRADDADDDADEDEDEDAGLPTYLLGSSVLPAVVMIGDARVQLGGLVVAAAKMSGHDTESWNALPDADREALLQTAIEKLSADPAVLAATIDPATILPPEPPAPVEIPDDWATLHHTKQVALAKTLDPAVTNKAGAVAVIQAELDKRAAA